MQFVGSYASYLALREDARAYEDVLTAMHGDADAQKIRDLQRRMSEGN